MSGDAQSRKRKDKRKKRGDPVEQRTDHFLKKSGLRRTEDSVEEDFFTPLKNSTDEVIHVQKDIVCGGNVVTKLIFFGLLASIGVMVGIILMEYRGSTDEETTSAVDSPWSVAFHDWIDQVTDIGHDREDEHVIEEHGKEDHGHDSHEKVHKLEGSEGGKGVSWILSWLNFGPGSEEEIVEDKITEEADEGIFSWFKIGGKEENKDEVEENNGGGWFGFDGDTEDAIEEGEKEEEDKSVEINEDEEHDKEALMKSDEDEEEDEENESGEVDHINNDEDEENESGEVDHINNDVDDNELNNHETEDEEENESREINDEEENESEEINDEEKGDNESREVNDEDEEENESGEMNDEDKEDNASREINDEEEENESKYLNDDEEEYEPRAFNDEDEEENESRNINDEEEEEQSSREYNEQKQNGEAHSHLFYDDDKDEKVTDSLLEGTSQEVDKKTAWYGVDQPSTVEEQENIQVIDEEMFPEAIEALRREAEKEKSIAKELKEEKLSENAEQEPELDSADESVSNIEETEGMALKFGVGVALVVVAHIVLVKKWNSWANGDEVISTEIVLETTEVPSEVHEAVTEELIVTAVPVKTEASLPPSPPVTESKFIEKAPVEEESADEGSPLEEESPVEEEEDEDLEIDKQKFRDLLAKYGQETPESSDVEQSDDDIQRVDYSEGEESPAGGEDVAEEEVGSEDDLKEWTGIKKTDVQESDSEVEEEVEEEESEEEAPPPPPPQPTWKKGGQRDFDEDYANTLITNDEDWAIKEELDRADEEFNYETAQTLYRALLVKHPNSPRARYGLALTLDKQAEKERSNVMLDLAIAGYKDALEAPNITDILFIQITSRLIDRLRFRGQHINAVPIHKLLIQKFNSTPEYRTDLAITYLMVNRLEDARLILKELLHYWNRDPTALAHYGLVLKLQGNIHGCVKYFEEGLNAAYKPLSDPRLYFHYGDALARVGRNTDALKVYDSAVDLGLFRSRYQRSLYNVDRLTARPWWTLEETTYASFFKTLEDNWEKIRDEGVEALKLNGMFKDEAEGLRDKGNWKQFELFARGSKMKKNCEVTPFTCSLIGSFESAATCKRGQSKFSIMDAGTHVWPHCGPTNCRLRAHLGLIVPPGPRIRVANITSAWKEGKVMIFDDSFEHEVWHDGSSLRLVLIVDVWHPELTGKEKITLSPI